MRKLLVFIFACGFCLPVLGGKTPKPFTKDCQLSLAVFPPQPNGFMEMAGWQRAVQRAKWYFKSDPKPLIAQPDSFFIRTTPERFLKRDRRAGFPDHEKLVRSALKMKRAEAETLYAYLLNRHMPEAVNANVEAALLDRWPNGIVYQGQTSIGAFEYRRNVIEALHLLAAYDRTHNTIFTPEIAFVVLKTYNWDQHPEIAADIFKLIPERVIEVSNDPSQHDNKRAIARFFAALQGSKAAKYLYGDAETPLRMAEMLRLVSTVDELEKPNLKHVESAVIHTLVGQAHLASTLTKAEDILNVIAQTEFLAMKADALLGDEKILTLKGLIYKELDLMKIQLKAPDHRPPADLNQVLQEIDAIDATTP